ncbi:NAD(P)-binding domain-containing protein [Pseudonocardia adelaidensis]|uniref:NAD(P)-binding domain-containing protein n=1 Tax=Pseudonocardia adelaidensis TaxID=648754 RepID=UPI003CD0A7E6
MARAGHAVTAGSRDPDRRAAGWTVPVPLTGLAEAAERADVVVNATPGAESVGLLRPLAPQLAGAVLVDVANAVVQGARRVRRLAAPPRVQPGRGDPASAAGHARRQDPQHGRPCVGDGHARRLRHIAVGVHLG